MSKLLEGNYTKRNFEKSVEKVIEERPESEENRAGINNEEMNEFRKTSSGRKIEK